MAASSITVNNQQTRRPGIYTEPDFTGLAGGGALARGVVAIVGAFKRLKPCTPVACASASAVKRVLPDVGAQLASLMFQPSRDSRIKGGAKGVLVVRCDCALNPVTRASLLLPAAGVQPSVTLWSGKFEDDSTGWGVDGNRTTVLKETGTLANTHKLTITLDGKTEVIDNMGGLRAFTVRYTGGYATTMALTVNPLADPRVMVKYTKTALAAPPVLTAMAFDGTIKFTTSGAVAVDDTTFVIVGTSVSGATTETVTIAVGQTTATSVQHWKSVASITPAHLGANTYTMEGNAFALNLADYPTVQRIVTQINTKSSAGFAGVVTTTVDPNALLPTDLDALASSDVIAAVAGPMHDLWSVIQAVNSQSSLVWAERTASAVAPPANTALATNLAGGSDGGVPAAADWELALASLQDQFCNHVWVDSESAAVHAKLDDHLEYMWAQGRDERCGWVGVPAGTSKAATLVAAANLNSQYLQLLAQEIRVYDPDGNRVWLAPSRLALLLAGMKCATAVGEPLTQKFPNVLDFRQDSSWSPAADAEAMIAGGVVFLSRTHEGIVVERSVTTYLQSDNDALTEQSAVESMGESCKDLRRYLHPIVTGSRNTVITVEKLAGLSTARLDRQADPTDLALIKGWQSLTVEDLGSYWSMDFEEALIEPNNFVKITPHAVRIQKNV